MSATPSDYKSLLNQYATRLWYLEGNVIYLSPPEPTVSGGASKSAGKCAAPKRYSLDGMVIHAAADPAARPDGEQIARFIGALHEQAARAIGDVERAGYMQLSVLFPDSKGMVPIRYKIGDIDGCVRAATDYANSGHNVYAEARTIKPETARGVRGDTEDTAWVFAFVIDADEDKEKGCDLGNIEPTMIVESSLGNSHYWFFLDKAITAGQAKPVGDAMRKGTGTDSGTGNICQPFRVAGTPNFPDKKKRDRGGVLGATRVVDYRPDALWTPEKLQAAFAVPKKEKQRNDEKPKPRNLEERILPPDMMAAVQTDVPDGERSQRFMGVVAKLKRKLWPIYQSGTLDKIVELFERHPDGIANKYAGRVREETKRCYDKIDEGRDLLPVIDIKEGEIPRMVEESHDALIGAKVPLYARDKYVVMPHKQVFDAADGRKTRARF